MNTQSQQDLRTGRRPSSPLQCAVKRRVFSVGDRPTRQLSLQPVAIGAAEEVTNPSKPLMERVAKGDSASRQAVTCSERRAGPETSDAEADRASTLGRPPP